ncbi:unnamed protein product [Eruca vesicaria subsp. sativa]|uniref:AB hydrolase-1 domain-containing protein n=1 Tax=Eruca vesicaria subsp. sativa TaxID=29727 RepID=A0ABC8K0Q5_ERUVS|nr:unnamed protein product [Eruca vesicaria subsp. sativa]
MFDHLKLLRCFSFTASRDWLFKQSFSHAGLRSVITDLSNGNPLASTTKTSMHCWIPKYPNRSKPNLLLLHGFGANAMWQYGEHLRAFTGRFNVYVPDLLFFGLSSTSEPNRSESFQAQCLMRLMEAHGVKKMSVVGISYGGFVGYSFAAQFPEKVEKIVLCCAGVCLEEKDMEDGLFKVMCMEYVEEKRDLIKSILKDRRLSDLPRIKQKSLIIWGEEDQIFPLELGYRLKRHIGDNADIVVIKKAGHAVNLEKSKEFLKHLKSFLIDSL